MNQPENAANGNNDPTGSPLSRRQVLLAGGATAGGWLLADATTRAATAKPVVWVFVGPSTHPPGTHEVGAAGRLLKHLLDHLPGEPFTVEVHSSWPKREENSPAPRSIIFIGDLFPPAVLPDSANILKQIGQWTKQGMGMVCLHYATGLEAKHVGPNGEHPLLEWIGGYFATRCKHHQSVARVFNEATIEPASDKHPIASGWKTFTFRDEPYIQNYFGPKGLLPPVVALAKSQLPPEKPQTEVVAWGVERADGGRGVGIVMPHFYRNWQNTDFRKLVVNAMVWTAKGEIPASGCDSTLPDLKEFQPGAIDPPQKKK